MAVDIDAVVETRVPEFEGANAAKAVVDGYALYYGDYTSRVEFTWSYT